MIIKDNIISNFRLEDNTIKKKTLFAIVVSEWHSKITERLKNGILKTFSLLGINKKNIKIFKVPGSFELVFVSNQLSELLKFNVIICVGSILKGETNHYHYISSAVIYGIKDINLKNKTPVILCLLTDNNIEESFERSGGKYGNKGIESAIAAVKIAILNKSIKKLIKKDS